jgi:hypothetical protein
MQPGGWDTRRNDRKNLTTWDTTGDMTTTRVTATAGMQPLGKILTKTTRRIEMKNNINITKTISQQEREFYIARFNRLSVGDLDEIDLMPLDDLKNMVIDLERAQAAGKLNLETDAGVNELEKIINNYVG